MSGMVHISRNPATPESIRQDFIYTLFEAQLTVAEELKPLATTASEVCSKAGLRV